MKILIIAGILVAIGICCTYALNVSHIESNDRNVESYHEFSPWIYAFVGIVLLLTAWFTFHFHFAVGIVQYALGALMLGYGLYLGFIKIGVIC